VDVEVKRLVGRSEEETRIDWKNFPKNPYQ
jgi:hypothetical protein